MAFLIDQKSSNQRFLQTWFAQSTLYESDTAKQILALRGPHYFFDGEELGTDFELGDT